MKINCVNLSFVSVENVIVKGKKKEKIKTYSDIVVVDDNNLLKLKKLNNILIDNIDIWNTEYIKDINGKKKYKINSIECSDETIEYEDNYVYLSCHYLDDIEYFRYTKIA